MRAAAHHAVQEAHIDLLLAEVQQLLRLLHHRRSARRLSLTGRATNLPKGYPWDVGDGRWKREGLQSEWEAASTPRPHAKSHAVPLTCKTCPLSFGRGDNLPAHLPTLRQGRRGEAFRLGQFGNALLQHHTLHLTGQATSASSRTMANGIPRVLHQSLGKKWKDARKSKSARQASQMATAGFSQTPTGWSGAEWFEVELVTGLGRRL